MEASKPGSLDFKIVARQLIRAIRGKRSQTDLSRRLGYKSNILHRWERGECWPTTDAFFRMCQLRGVDIEASLTTFYGRRPGWLQEATYPSREGYDPLVGSRFLNDLRGKIPIVRLAESTGYNRFTLARWIKGAASPNLPAFLSVVEATSGRLLDYIASLVDPERVPVICAQWQRLEEARGVAYSSPWSHAVLRALEFESDSGALATALGISVSEVEKQLQALKDTGQIRRKRGRWVPAAASRVNTGRDIKRARILKAAWMRIALERLERGADGLFGYTVFAVSEADLERVRALQLDYVTAMNAIVAASSPTERVALFSVQLLDLRDGAPQSIDSTSTS